MWRGYILIDKWRPVNQTLSTIRAVMSRPLEIDVSRCVAGSLTVHKTAEEIKCFRGAVYI